VKATEPAKVKATEPAKVKAMARVTTTTFSLPSPLTDKINGRDMRQSQEMLRHSGKGSDISALLFPKTKKQKHIF
jgi:hypothetical protein